MLIVDSVLSVIATVAPEETSERHSKPIARESTASPATQYAQKTMLRARLEDVRQVQIWTLRPDLSFLCLLPRGSIVLA